MNEYIDKSDQVIWF